MTTTSRHPDYAAIIRALREGDLLARSMFGYPVERQVEQALSGIADLESLRLVATRRADGLLEDFADLILLFPDVALIALWVDAFVTGVRFQQAGGHTEQLPEE
jgi:hypothetical protein